MEDALEVCTRMWTGDQGTDGPYDGHHVHAGRLLNGPQALHRPRPPIMVAGDGERRTLALAARYAHACSLRPSPEIPHKLDVLRRHCEASGTDPDRIEVTVGFAFTADDGGPATRGLLDQLRWPAGLGVQTVIGRVEGLERRTPIEQLARHAVPIVADLEPTR